MAYDLVGPPDPDEEALHAHLDANPDLEAELARIYGIDPNAAEPAAEPDSFQPSTYQSILESLAGLADVQAPRPQNFGQGLVTGLAQGVGTAGSRVAKARATFEAKQAERQKANDVSRIAASRAYRDKLAESAIGTAKSRREGQAKDDAEKAKRAYESSPEYLAQVEKEALARARGQRTGAPPAEPGYREERIPVTADLLKEFPQFKGLKTIGSDDLIKARTPSAASTKPSTGEQKQALAFYNRGKDSLAVLETPDKSGQTLEDRIAAVNPALSAFGQRTINVLKGRDRQLYEQAQRSFTQAKLRKESGAAISQAEYDQDAVTYFAQPGDSPELIAQKKADRDAVLEGLKFQAGPAYEEFYGQPATTPAAGSAQSRVTAQPTAKSYLDSVGL